MNPTEDAGPSDPGAVTPSMSRVAPWSRFEEAALDSRVRRRLFTASRAMVVVCDVSSRSFSTPRVNDLDEVTTILRGQVEIRLGDRVVLLEPGQSVRIPARTAHSVRRTGPGAAEVLNVLFPPIAPESPVAADPD